ncbi:map kinase kinase kinase [Moniliophthora roreri MCA 2997]|uniref:Map kinase kinase kinase n=1 Tax=Moniliophthora roreri (strain MCA 2997) TaxID=1381753 RepID=V2XKH5_MONRO|nr:map kinase kinase kinase [Moniliophthora roreri MCA 2997]
MDCYHWLHPTLASRFGAPSSANPNNVKSVLPTIRIIVSSNAEQYRVVELTGSPDGSCIRERILAQLRIPDSHQSRYSIYQSEVGAYALGAALNDTTLFDLCQQYGDSSGSLRFFVSTSPNRPPTRMEPEYPDYPYS